VTDVVTEALEVAILSALRWSSKETFRITKITMRNGIDTAAWRDASESGRARYRAEDELPKEIGVDELADALQSNEVQACLLELLALRLTGASDSTVQGAKKVFAAALYKRQSKFGANSFNELYCYNLIEYYDRQISALVRYGTVVKDINVQASRIAAVAAAAETRASSLVKQIPLVVEKPFLASYRGHVRDLHGKLTPPDLERRQRIPIADLYVSPRIIYGKELQTITMDRFANELDRTVLLGDPGGGKSTAAAVLAYNFARDERAQIPFLVVLRDFASGHLPLNSVIKHIENMLEILYQCPAPQDLVSQLLLSGRAIVIFDGLDELIDTSHRARITNIVEQFCLEYPHTPVLVTSRIVGYDQARLDASQFTCYQLDGFNDAEAAEYVEKWFQRDLTVDREGRTRLAQGFIQESASVADLRRNPLMLALICILYHGEGFIPRNRPEVYQQCAELLFRKWDARRHIRVELKARFLVEATLRHLAYWLWKEYAPRFVVSESRLIAETSQFLCYRGFEYEEEAEEAAREFIYFCRGRAWVFSDAGTTKDGESLYRFTHRTFLEYFAACYLAFSIDTPEELARRILPHVEAQEWDVVAELALQKKEQISDRGAERTIAEMLTEVSVASTMRLNVLQFVSRCVLTIDVPPSTIRTVTQSVLAYVESDLSANVESAIAQRRTNSPNAEVLLEPLTYLFRIDKERRRVVADEIDKWISRTTKGPSAGIKASALLVLGQLAEYARSHTKLHPDDVFWQETATDILELHQRDINEMAVTDPGIARLALFQNLIGLSALGPIDTQWIYSLFSPEKPSIFHNSKKPYMVWALELLITEWPSPPPAIIDSFDAFGQAACSAHVPWNIIQTDFVSISAIPGPVWHQMRLSGYALFGALVTAAVLLEISQEGASKYTKEMSLIERLPGFERYMQGRTIGIGNTVNLPRLPIPDECMRILKSWARDSMSFTSTGAAQSAYRASADEKRRTAKPDSFVDWDEDRA
jgi:hypothetical protein